ncbi:hypothetical protein FHS34_004938 [Streptomyces echinatus]|uniref:Uncharacterized protein n=1 Tax=Streptomyces echinatus TaxID=67293 RepID=A0A7W9PXA5_9ACTN|nr:hypothetical protein [Streptomyces echinatus]
MGRVQQGPLTAGEFQVDDGETLVELGHRGGTDERYDGQFTAQLPGRR